MKNNFSFTLVLIVLFTAVFLGVSYMLHLPIGDFIDWITGIGAFWWLMFITTVPWNLHFKAKEVLNEIKTSKKKNISISTEDYTFAKKTSVTHLIIAISLHSISAIVLYYLAWSGISPIGYIGAIVALLLTALRPSVRMYDYLYQKLITIGKKVRYPREDILLVNERIETMNQNIKHILDLLNEEDKHSWRNKKEIEIKEANENMISLKKDFDNLLLDINKKHENLLHNTEKKIALLSEDAQFLNQARQLVRFIKDA